MVTKRQRKAAGRKGAQTRKRNILLGEGFTSEEIEERHLDRRSFESKEVKQLRGRRSELIAEGEVTFANVHDPRERRQVAVAYALQFRDPQFRLERLRESRLEEDGFTRAE